MKFMLHFTPVVPATPEERERLAPIAHRTDKTQEMLEEMVDLAQFAEEAAFDALSYSEHHFYTEGLEAGATPIPHMLNLIHHTKRIQVGPVGFVLPTWDPICLAEDIAWVDQILSSPLSCRRTRLAGPRGNPAIRRTGRGGRQGLAA